MSQIICKNYKIHALVGPSLAQNTAILNDFDYLDLVLGRQIDIKKIEARLEVSPEDMPTCFTYALAFLKNGEKSQVPQPAHERPCAAGSVDPIATGHPFASTRSQREQKRRHRGGIAHPRSSTFRAGDQDAGQKLAVAASGFGWSAFVSGCHKIDQLGHCL